MQNRFTKLVILRMLLVEVLNNSLVKQLVFTRVYIWWKSVESKCEEQPKTSYWCYRGLDRLNLSTLTNVTAPTRLFIVPVIIEFFLVHLCCASQFFFCPPLAFQAESPCSRLVLSCLLRTDAVCSILYTACVGSQEICLQWSIVTDKLANTEIIL